MKIKNEQFSDEQLEKIGNTIIYLLNKISNMPKTKLLKLLYILDEEAMKRSGMPFLNLNYKVWHLGPVAEEIFNDLSSDEITLLSKYISIKETAAKATYYNAEKEFCSDEFSKSDIKFLDEIIKDFGSFSAEELVKYTHREGTIWHKIAKNEGLTEVFNNKKRLSSDFDIDLTELIKGDKRKEAMYKEYQLFN
jgi:uncharacterized phage-associated protein